MSSVRTSRDQRGLWYSTTKARNNDRSRKARGEPGSWSWWDLPVEEDPYAQELIDEHYKGLSRAAVAYLFGVSSQRIYKMEMEALAKIYRRLHLGFSEVGREADHKEKKEGLS